MQFSEETSYVLRRAGWTENYRGDIEKYRQIYKNENTLMPPKVGEFLERFGGLKVESKHHRSRFLIDPGRLPGFFSRGMQRMSRIVGKPLYPIGGGGGDVGYYMDEGGNVYEDMLEPEIYHIGNTGEEAIEALFTDQPYLATISDPMFTE